MQRKQEPAPPEAEERMRLDKWLWVARFYKTRGLATEEIDKGRVQLNGAPAKPGKEIKAGDTVAVRREGSMRTVVVLGLSHQRGPAPVARLLYEDTPDSLRALEAAAERRRYAPEPAMSIEHGRPTKRGRRELEQVRGGWGERWSVSLDDADD